MSSAHSWSVKGIDPKVREAAREAAARQGMSLGEYLSQALANHHVPTAPTPPAPQQRLRAARLPHPYDEEEEDWAVSAPAASPRGNDPLRLAQRIDAIERRTQLAISGLDRAVTTIDRSMLGLSSRIDDAESMSSEAADRIAEALEHFRIAGDTLGGRLESAEREASKNRDELRDARDEMSEARERLEAQAAAAEQIAKKAEAAAHFLATEIEARDAALANKFDTLGARVREELDHGLAKARESAQQAARDAADASAEAISELRALQQRFAEQLEASQNQGGATAEAALREARATRTALAEEARLVRESLIEEVVRLESEIGGRIGSMDELRLEQGALIARIEKAEMAARESTAGLRQAAGAAIADLRNAQLGLAARLKQVEDGAGRAGALDLGDVRAQQAEISSRLSKLETAPSSPVSEALAAFEKRLSDMSSRVGDTSAFEKRLEEIAARVGESAASDKLNQVDGAVKTLDESLQRLSARLAETESTANNAIRTLEETVSGITARIEGASPAEETEKLRSLLENRLDEMTQTVTQMVGEARTELAGQVQAALSGQEAVGLEAALEDTNRRLAAAERRQAQTIEAISIEIKRMSETVDRRLRAVETKADSADTATTVRDELSRMAGALETRFEEIERREAAAFDRMGIEIGRLSERLEDRVGAVEGRSAQAIEQVGEQVARMAERFNQRHDLLARELGERMLDSEERAGARVSEAINSIMQRLGEVEERSSEVVAPVRKAVSDVASRLESLVNAAEPMSDMPTTTRHNGDFGMDPDYEPYDPEPYVSPMQSAQPLRAGPLPPTNARAIEPDADSDIYFADDDDDFIAETPAQAARAAPESVEDHVFENVIEEDHFLDDDAFSDEVEALDPPPPPEDSDPFWAPDAPEPAPSQARADLPDAIFDDAPIEPPTPPGKNDYLNAARKAALAQAQPPKARKEKDAASYDSAPAPTYSLRGSSRVVLWGAASAVALLVAGGAWYYNETTQAARPSAEPSAPEPETTPLTQSLAPEAQPYDPNAAFGAPLEEGADPAVQGGVDGMPEEPAGAAEASAAPHQAALQGAVVARPLAPRAVSLEQAARDGDVVAQYELGLQRLTAGQSDEGVGLLRRAADRGLAMAQYRLAKLYERGEGVPTDLQMARQWTERAAAAGNRRAMHDLGVYFARGEGAPLDEAAAFRWFRQAAELGVADSQYNLGVLYQQGRGVGASSAEAMFWFLVASRQGDQDAGARAAALEAQLTPVQIEQARARAEAFRPRAASAQANGQFGPRPWSAEASTVRPRA